MHPLTLKAWGIFLLTLICFLPVAAQDYVLEADTTEQVEENRKRRYVENFHVWLRTFNESYEGLKGTPLVSPEFVEGVVVTNRNARKEFENINYEVYQNEVVVLNERGNFEFLPKGMIKSFCLYHLNGQDSLLFKKFRSPEDQEVFFAQVLYVGEYTYIKKYEKYIQEANYQGAYNAGIPYDEFKDRVKYFSVNKKGEMLAFKPSKKGLEKIFPDKKSTIKAFWRENYPNLKSDIRMIEALATISNN